MNELKKLVKALEKKDNKTEQIAALQAIGKELVNNFVIEFPDDIVIRPLWVEAYYADADCIDDMYISNNTDKFIDPFIHGKPIQKGEENFGKLYFHHKTDDRRSGVDICLSCGSYYLSFLLKFTLVNDIYTTQSQLSGQIRESYQKLTDEQQSNILCRVKNEAKCLTCTTRIGLNAQKEKKPEKKKRKEQYQPMELAVVRDFHKKFSDAKSLPQKETLIKQYLNDSDKTMSEKASFCKEYLGYCPSEYKQK